MCWYGTAGGRGSLSPQGEGGPNERPHDRLERDDDSARRKGTRDLTAHREGPSQRLRHPF